MYSPRGQGFHIGICLQEAVAFKETGKGEKNRMNPEATVESSVQNGCSHIPPTTCFVTGSLVALSSGLEKDIGQCSLMRTFGNLGKVNDLQPQPSVSCPGRDSKHPYSSN